MPVVYLFTFLHFSISLFSIFIFLFVFFYLRIGGAGGEKWLQTKQFHFVLTRIF
jgi:hypothetical protein